MSEELTKKELTDSLSDLNEKIDFLRLKINTMEVDIENRLNVAERLLIGSSGPDLVQQWVESSSLAPSSPSTRNLSQSTVIGVGGGTVNHLEWPAIWFRVRYSGTNYRIPLYPDNALE